MLSLWAGFSFRKEGIIRLGEGDHPTEIQHILLYQYQERLLIKLLYRYDLI
jgi:hypothetical protein